MSASEADSKDGAGGAGLGWPDIAIRLALAAIVIYWSFSLLRPFIPILIWSAILSVAMHPVYLWLTRTLGGRGSLAALLLTTVTLLVILVPLGVLGSSLVKNLSQIATGILEGEITVPPPPPFVYDLPLIGNRIAGFWETASVELGETLKTIEPQLNQMARKLLGLVGNIGLGVLQFTAAIIIAAFIHGRAAVIHAALQTMAERAAPQLGEGFLDLAGGTVRSVARGVVGISLVQAILFGIGALAAGIPFTGVWTFFVLILAIIQVGPAVVIVPVIIFGWMTMDTASAVILTAYMIPVTLFDNVMKPIIMGRGLPVPMLVIFIGVIGGTLAHGLIGVFVGPIVLAFGYELARAWIAARQGKEAR